MAMWDNSGNTEINEGIHVHNDSGYRITGDINKTRGLDLNDKSVKIENRTRFRHRAFWLVVGVVLIGAGLALAEKADNFGAIAAGAFTFAGAVFVADYATKVDTD